MCSVVGYIGKNKSRDVLIEGLSRLEYRGYDSSGFACLESKTQSLYVVKETGQLNNLKKALKKQSYNGSIGIGHTRWATHGAATQENAHPHTDCSFSIAVVHNGIIENNADLKFLLEKDNHIFSSETDTEIIAHLFEEYTIHKKMNPFDALQKIVKLLQGAYAFVLLSEQFPESLFVARKGSPLCIGIGVNEMFIGSDPLAFSGQTSSVLFLPEESFALIKKDSYMLYDFSGKLLSIDPQEVDAAWVATEKGEHEHYMLKEIYEQKHAIEKTISSFKLIKDSLLDSIGMSQEGIESLDGVTFLGCGTSWHAGKIAEFFFEEIAHIPTTSELASEFRHKTFFNKKNHLYIALSQSGETADTLEAIRLVKEYNQPTMVITNVASSTLVRECDGFLLTQAGPEIAVASTKAFSSQIATLYWFAHYLSYAKKLITQSVVYQAEKDLIMTAEVLENVIEQHKHAIMYEDAQFYKKFKQFIFLGRHSSYPFAQEVALKLKEIAYVFADAYPAGELKHGPLALVDASVPVVIFSHADPVIYQKLLANAQEVKARNGHIIVFALSYQTELLSLADRSFIIPSVPALLLPLAMTGVTQFFCYSLAKISGHAIDKPRNLAKSVTVE